MRNKGRIGVLFAWCMLVLGLTSGSVAAQSELHLPLLAFPSPICTDIVPACNLTNTSEVENTPAWSPDGAQILYVRHASTPGSWPASGIYQVAAQGGYHTLLAQASYEPTWSPDGTKIAFTRGALYVMQADGSQVVEIAPYRSQAPVWSPDGTKIAYQHFTTFDDCCDIAGSLNVVTADGSQRFKLAEDVTLTAPSWSPDGSKITAGVYLSGTTGTDIFVINADSSNPINLTNDAPYNSAAVWSPDGSKIAFISANGDTGNLWHLYVMEPDGDDKTQLTTTPFRFDTFDSPVWSPDSSQLLYLTNLEPNTGKFGIYRVNAAGSEDPQLIYQAEGGAWGQPRWSPDGSKIAFASGYDIYILGLEE